MQNQNQLYTEPAHVISLDDQIQCFELSGYEWSQNLVCIAVQSKIILGIIKFPVSVSSLPFKCVYIFLIVSMNTGRKRK